MLPVEIQTANLPLPDWGIVLPFQPEIPFGIHIKHIFEVHRGRIMGAIKAVFPDMTTVFSDPQNFATIEVWFREEFERQINVARQDPSHVSPQWYNTKKCVDLLLPLFLKGKLVLVASFERISCESETIYNMTTVIWPAWAYNNMRILGPIQSGWLNEKTLKSLEASVWEVAETKGTLLSMIA